MKRFLAGVAVLLALAAVGIIASQIVLSRLISRDRIIALVKKQTGDDITFARITTSAFPHIGLTLSDVTLRDPHFFEAGDVAHLAKLRIAVGIIPLLRRDVQVQRIELEGGQLRLLRDASGRADWSPRPTDTSSGEGAAPPSDNGLRSGSKRDFRIRLDGVTLRNVDVSLKDLQGGRSADFFIGSAMLEGMLSRSPYVDIHARHGETPFSLSGHVGAIDDIFNVGKPWHIGLGLVLGEGDHKDGWINYSGSVRDVAHLTGWSGEIKARLRRSEQLQSIFSHTPIPTIHGLSGRMVFRDMDGSVARGETSVPQGEWYQSIKVEMADLDIGRIALPGGLEGHDISLSARNPGDAVKFSAIVPGNGKDLSVQVSIPVLSDLNDALQSDFEKSLTFSARLAPDTHRLAFFDRDGVVHVNGQIGRSQSSFDIEGAARLLPVGPFKLEDSVFNLHLDAKPGSSFDLTSFKLRSRALSLEGKAQLTMPKDASDKGVVNADLHVLAADMMALKTRQSTPSHDDARRSAPPATASGAKASGDAVRVKPGASRDDKAGQSDAALVLSDAFHQPLSPEFLSAYNWHVAVDGQNLKFGDRSFNGVKVNATYLDHTLNIDMQQANAGSDTLKGSVIYHLSETGAPLTIHASPVILPAELILKALNVEPVLSGPVELVGDVSGPATSRDDFLSKMTGHIGASMVGGKIWTAPFRKYVKNGLGAFLDGNDLPVRCLGLHMILASDRLNVDVLGLDAGPVGVTGQGTLRRGDNALDFLITPEISIAGTGASSPLAIGGTLDHPRVVQQRGGDGRAGFSIGGQKKDVCPNILNAAREGESGATPPALKKSSGAEQLLKGLGLFQ